MSWRLDPFLNSLALQLFWNPPKIMDSKGFVIVPFVFLPASGVWSNPAGSRHVTTWSTSQLLANSFVLALAPFFFSLFSVWTPLPLSCPAAFPAAFHCCKCWSRGPSGCCRPGWTLKGSRSLFLKLLFTGRSFKVSFRKCFSSGCDVNPVWGCSRAS